jgi:hypothetical protein
MGRQHANAKGENAGNIVTGPTNLRSVNNPLHAQSGQQRTGISESMRKVLQESAIKDFRPGTLPDSNITLLKNNIIQDSLNMEADERNLIQDTLNIIQDKKNLIQDTTNLRLDEENLSHIRMEKSLNGTIVSADLEQKEKSRLSLQEHDKKQFHQDIENLERDKEKPAIHQQDLARDQKNLTYDRFKLVALHE